MIVDSDRFAVFKKLANSITNSLLIAEIDVYNSVGSVFVRQGDVIIAWLNKHRQTTGYMPKLLEITKKWRLQIESGEWISLAVMLILLLLLVANLVRSMGEANRNYQVLLSEQELLAQMQSENLSLQTEYKYFTSYEYKKLYARDNLRLAEPGERLYQIVGDAKLYQIEPDKLEVFDQKSGYAQWWGKLLGM